MHNSFSPLLQPPPETGQYAETQFEIIRQYIQEFQSSLDPEHDVGVLLANFGGPVQMEVTGIGFRRPVLMVFEGYVGAKRTTLFQHVNQLNFMLQAVPIPEGTPRREIGFNADWGGKP